MSLKSKKSQKIQKVVLLLFGLVSIVVVAMVLRPDNEDLAPKELKIPTQKTIIDEMGDLAKLKPLENTGEAPGKKLGDVPLDRSIVSQKMQKREDVASDKKENKDSVWSRRKREENGKMSNDFSMHEGMAVHAKDVIDTSSINSNGYPVVEADFSKLRPLNFRSLKKVYTYFRLKDSFPEVVLKSLNGSAVEMVGAVMPVEKIPEDGVFPAFWLSNPVIVLAGCVFCNPPTLADIVYVEKKSGETPFSIEREKLFKQVVLVKVTGRFFFGPESTGDQTYLFSIEAKSVEVLN